jgi:dimethylglycine dehydrogenase
MVEPKHAELGTELEIEILGTRYPASVIPDSPFDPNNERLRDIHGVH